MRFVSLQNALRKRFAPPEWACLFEVRNATGYSAPVTRYADALAFNLWPARGLEVHGIEVKISRSDWLREKNDPAKSSPIQRFCDRWWLAISDSTIVQDGELPPTWGLLVLNKAGRLIQKTEAPKLEPEPFTKGFIASLLRNVTETTVPRQFFNDQLRERVEGVRTANEEANLRRAERAELVEKQLQDRIERFESLSGIHIDRWEDPEKIGEAVRFVMRHRGSIRTGLTRARNELERLVAEIDKVRDEHVSLDEVPSTAKESAV